MSTDSKLVAFGDTKTSTPLGLTSGRLITDNLLAQVKQAGVGGINTTRYYDQCNLVGQLYAQVAAKGDDAWTKGEDLDGHEVWTVTMLDGNGQVYYMKLALEGVKVEANDQIVQDKGTINVNGTDYNTIGMLTHTVGYSNFEFSKTSRVVGIGAAGGGISKIVWGYASKIIYKGMVKMRTAITKGIKAIYNSVKNGSSTAAEDAAINSSKEGEEGLIEEGIETGGVDAVDAVAVAAGAVFIAAVIIVGIILLGLSFVLHNSYHQLRVWNLTKYVMEWNYWIDTNASSSEGHLVTGPGALSDDGKSIIPQPIAGAGKGSLVPGVKPTPHVSYGDFTMMSQHEYKGIGWVLQLALKDPQTKETVQTVTTYYDIPWIGDNSTNLTCDKVDDVASWYKRSQGNNRMTVAYNAGTYGDVTFSCSSTYDYLSGEHPVPSAVVGSSNTAYYYQSVLVIEQMGLKVEDLPSV